MNQSGPDLVRVGVGEARIKSVSPQRVEYVDERGRECFVDLEECGRSWDKSFADNSDDFVRVAPKDSTAVSNVRYAGERDLSGHPPWVEFANQRRTRFEFGSYEEAYRLLMTPLAAAGWRTFDTD